MVTPLRQQENIEKKKKKLNVNWECARADREKIKNKRLV